MFLEETIPSGSSPEETIEQIKKQGGLVCIPHPFDRFRPSAMKSATLARIVEYIDIIEVFNARTLPYQNMNKPRNFARQHDLVQGAGSDAHTLAEIGNAYVELPEFEGRDDFLEALAQGNIGGHRTSPFTHFFSLGNRIKKKLRGG
jgi:predicted metal-dependent phosphoesterase TrpH